MDLYKAIQELYAEKEKLERVIASLEELQRTSGELPQVLKPGRRRGRKSMSQTERQEVSERMKRYWQSRRQRGGSEAEDEEEASARGQESVGV
jgi:hypothetical protein